MKKRPRGSAGRACGTEPLLDRRHRTSASPTPPALPCVSGRTLVRRSSYLMLLNRPMSVNAASWERSGISSPGAVRVSGAVPVLVEAAYCPNGCFGKADQARNLRPSLAAYPDEPTVGLPPLRPSSQETPGPGTKVDPPSRGRRARTQRPLSEALRDGMDRTIFRQQRISAPAPPRT